jgi:preprotein translocase subunit SecF
MKSLRDFNIDFMGVRNVAFGISLALVLAAIVLLVVRGINFGLDFTGGTLVEVQFKDPVRPEQVRAALEAGGFTSAVVQNYGSERDLLVRMPPQGDIEQALLGDRVGAALVGQWPGALVQRSEFVGPAVGEELRETGGLAMIVALVSVMIYIMFRFTGKFAVGAVVALVHDVIITLGAFALLQWQFDLPSLAAVLAVIGYSINDTIVVADRIRENFRALRRKTPIETINISINQTLDRTLGTSGSTLLVVGALLVLGGSAVSGFADALMVGIGVGTYSSIYIAANVTVMLGVTRDDMMLPEKERGEAAPP